MVIYIYIYMCVCVCVCVCVWPNIFCGMVSHALGPKTTSNILHKLWPSAVDYNNEISDCFT